MSTTHKYDAEKMLLGFLRHKILAYPGILLANRARLRKADMFMDMPEAPLSNQEIGNDMLYDFDPVNKQGTMAFMPVKIGELTIPLAVMTISGKKTIVETALTGARGTVKELISVDDYDISITGMLYNADGLYPEAEIKKFMELYNRNESVSLVSALTDLVFEQGSDKVVIKSINFHDMKGCEEMQGVTITCVSDAPFELIIK